MVKNKGYTLAAVLIFTTLIVIGLTVVLQSWTNLIQRDREEELIFVGLQYIQAIKIFQQRNGRFPNTLKELSEHGFAKFRCIRKLYKDPITNSDKWGLIYANNTKWPYVEPLNPVEGQPGIGLPPSTIEIKPLEGEEAPIGPIIGVFSTSKKESLRSFMGRKRYCDWEFTINLQILPGGAIVPPPSPGGGIPVDKKP